ncbi:MAG: tyrosine-type recombinase/integrase, partial [Deltaproteobacteria bacterium]|nr:tyrosine-type recombinase/integrase [Deltaproteobacteria bacterium]
MADKDIRMLMDAILDYMGRVKSVEDQKGAPSPLRYTRILTDFLIYVIHKGIAWEAIFTPATVEAFCTYSGYKGAAGALRALSDYLFGQGRIDQPLGRSRPQAPLPDVYEHYLVQLAQSREPAPRSLRQTRRLLGLLHAYLQRHGIDLSRLKIDHLDAFMGAFKVSDRSRNLYRYPVRGFLTYLYHERRIIRRDLAPLLVGPPLFAQRKLPRFLRPQQVKTLFASLTLSTPTHIRTYAMVHLAYALGLRPVEISRIALDNISFQKGELTLSERKADNPITLPLPEKTLKAIALYTSKARPQSPCRELFLTHSFPYRPISSNIVIQ